MADEQESPSSWRERLRAFNAESAKADEPEADEDAPEGGEADAEETGEGPGLGDRLGGLRDRAARVGGTLIPKQAVQRVAALPTPGGLGLIILALVFFVFVIVPVNANGDTRFALIWRALTGGATIPAGPRKRHAQALAAVQAQPASPSPVQAILSDAEQGLGALSTFWIDHVVG